MSTNFLMNGGRYPNILQHMTKVTAEQKSWQQLHLAEGAQELHESQIRDNS